jgi:SWI/SNF-related matrix-associated actin-dependent regulator 1 of chromatin subfamily A
MEQVYEWIDEFLRDTDEKLLVFGRHKAILEPLYAKYEDQAVIITGDVSMNARHQVVKDFQNNKKIRLFVGNMAAAGVGIDLTAASEVAFIETAWTPGEHAQALDRAHRIGQTERVNCTWFVAHKTVEEKLCTLVQEKEIVMKGVLDGTNAEFEFNIMEKLMSELLGGM